MDTHTYINATESAEVAVAEIVRRVTDGTWDTEIDLDIETAPIPGLEGYPGSRRVLVTVTDPETGEERVEERFAKADKAEYLGFVQRSWRASFSPAHLQALGLYLPDKTTSGKVGDLTAGEAWSLFLKRVYELEATKEGREQLEAARWTQDRLATYLSRLQAEIDRLVRQREQQQAELEALRLQQAQYDEEAATTGRKPKKVAGIKKAERAVAKTQEHIEAHTQEIEFLNTEVAARIKEPIDLRLLTHVVKVAVEGRIALSKEGQNRLDPVQPGLDPYTSTIFLVQLSFTETATRTRHHYIFNTHKVPITVLLPIFQLRKVRFTGANIKFDLKHLIHQTGYRRPITAYCTRVGSRMYYLGLRRDHSLLGATRAFLGGTEWPERINKEVRNDFIGRRMAEPTPSMLQYAYTDTEVLTPLREAQLAKAEPRGQRELLENFGNLSWITAIWELTGYRLDQEKWLEIAAEAARSRDDLARELEQMLLPPNYEALFATQRFIEQAEAEIEEPLYDDDDEDDSRPAVDARKDAIIRISQGALVLSELGRVLGLDLKQVCPRGKPSLAKQARGAMERAYRAKNGGKSHPFFYKYNLWSKRAKQASTYGRRFLWYIHPLTGRIHPQFHIAGTDTGRYSSTGPNLLNIPAAKEKGDPDFRGAFLAEDGFYLLGADYDAMEFRIVGDISRDPVIKTMIEAGVDAHCFTAANMWHIQKADVSEVTKVEGVYRRGASEIPIPVFRVPKSWTPEQVVEFATRPEVAEAILEEVPEKITRSDGKTVTFRWSFRGGSYGLAEQTGLPVDTAEDLMNRFVDVYKVADAHLNKIGERVYTHTIEGNDGVLYAWSEGYGGIRRWAALPHNPSEREFGGNATAFYAAQKEYRRLMARASRQLCNLPAQGGNAVITCEALLALVKRGHSFGVLPWLAIYDEMIATAPDSVPPTKVKALLESAMLGSADRYMHYIPANAEANVEKAGKRWVKS